MSEKTAPDPELLESFAEEARRRCDVIAAGVATETEDFETMRAEAHALEEPRERSACAASPSWPA